MKKYSEFVPVNHEGVWKTPETVYARHNGEWKEVQEVWAKDGDEWKLIGPVNFETSEDWVEFCDYAARKINESNVSSVKAIAQGSNIILEGIDENEFTTQVDVIHRGVPEWAISRGVRKHRNKIYREFERDEFYGKFRNRSHKLSNVNLNVTITRKADYDNDHHTRSAKAEIEIPIFENLPVYHEDGYEEWLSLSKFTIDGIDYIDYPDEGCADVDGSPFTEFVLPTTRAGRTTFLNALAEKINSTDTGERDFRAKVIDNKKLSVTAYAGNWPNGLTITNKVINWKAKYEVGPGWDCQYLGSSDNSYIPIGVFGGGRDSRDGTTETQQTKISFGGVYSPSLDIRIAINGVFVQLID